MQDETIAHFIEFSLDIATTLATGVIMGISLTEQPGQRRNGLRIQETITLE